MIVLTYWPHLYTAPSHGSHSLSPVTPCVIPPVLPLQTPQASVGVLEWVEITSIEAMPVKMQLHCRICLQDESPMCCPGLYYMVSSLLDTMTMGHLQKRFKNSLKKTKNGETHWSSRYCFLWEWMQAWREEYKDKEKKKPPKKTPVTHCNNPGPNFPLQLLQTDLALDWSATSGLATTPFSDLCPWSQVKTRIKKRKKLTIDVTTFFFLQQNVTTTWVGKVIMGQWFTQILIHILSYLSALVVYQQPDIFFVKI